jgi:acid phosphatase class B
MRRAVICVTAGLAGVAIGFGLNSATSRSTTEIPVSTPTISVWEIHNQAHLEFLPVRQIDDQSRFHWNISLEARNSFDCSATRPLVESAQNLFQV